MKLKFSQLFQILFVFITVASIRVYTSLNLGSTTFWWLVDIVMIFIILKLKPHYFDKLNDNKNIWPIKLFLFWNMICIIRGLFVAENYWEWKNLVASSLVMLIPAFIYVFTNKIFVQQIVSFWLKYALLSFFLFTPFIIHDGFAGGYLVPILFLLLIFPLLSYRWKVIALFFTFIVFAAGLDARSNIIRFSVAGLLGMMYYFRYFIPQFTFKIMHTVFMLLPIILLFLALTDIFNIFKMSEYIKGDYTVMSRDTGELGETSLTADTRTFLYVENIQSALKHNYVLQGRTPANGYDSAYFGDFLKYELGTGKQERFSSEVSILNIFTWTGLIGVVLYFLVFLKATHLAIYRSNNYFIKIIGLFVAFRWSYAFVEDFTNFDIQYVFLWVLIGMCYSSAFRKMNDLEFKEWTKDLFKGNIFNAKIGR